MVLCLLLFPIYFIMMELYLKHEQHQDASVFFPAIQESIYGIKTTQEKLTINSSA